MELYTKAMDNLDSELSSKRAEKKAKHSESSLDGKSNSSSNFTEAISTDGSENIDKLHTSRSRSR